MGWTKRSDGVAHAYAMHNKNLAILERVAELGRSKKLAEVVAAVDAYITGCHLVGRQPNDNLIEICFGVLRRHLNSLSWRHQ